MKSVTLSNDAGTLRVGGLTPSTDVSESGYWSNVRLSADSSTQRPGLSGTTSLSLDVLVGAPTTISIAALPQSATHGWINPQRAVRATPDQFVRQPNGLYKATVTITAADTPNLAAIAADINAAGRTLTNLILFVGAQNGADVRLDNITFSGNRTDAPPTVEHAPLGTVRLPSTFEDGTRQGWTWDAASGVKGALTLQPQGGSQVLSWEVTYPDVKPFDGWASAPRLILELGNRTRGSDNFLQFDLYLRPEPGRGTQGALSVNLAFGPPNLGYWAQANTAVRVPLANLTSAPRTADGLVRVPVRFNLNDFDKTLASDTVLGKITLVVADDQSNFAGRMYLDEVRFSATAP
ncbi:carbohydrate-binding domain-containing protein [Deinococcus yavapaiensis]|uniref:carbohydrate-binding domain-containing protein n=1 Tax=Deinococcus yavapaiensis TaxID=309889 RepID=UPI001FE68FCE|nr:carbohydrate-binding domain-containing protein [Deinococcus yavapaiensis]